MNIYFVGINSYGNFMFKSDNDIRFDVLSLNCGIVTIKPSCSPSFEEFAKMLVSFFEPGSNFYGVQVIQVSYYGIYFHITAKEANLENLMRKYKTYSSKPTHW